MIVVVDDDDDDDDDDARTHCARFVGRLHHICLGTMMAAMWPNLLLECSFVLLWATFSRGESESGLHLLYGHQYSQLCIFRKLGAQTQPIFSALGSFFRVEASSGLRLACGDHISQCFKIFWRLAFCKWPWVHERDIG